MNWNEVDEKARLLIEKDSSLVRRHLDYLRRMVAIDSRSFGVGEFEGDRKTPSDMKEILSLAEEYLRAIGFPFVKINEPPPGPQRSTPILMAEIFAGKGKPTILCYAHLDKQPYMDGGNFEKWSGVPPTELRLNADGSRAYGRGAADDLSGVTAIGMAVDALLQSVGFDARQPSPEKLAQLPCNIKVIYETEEECGSQSLIDQIQQNRDFFAPSDCVVITDVVNPAQGYPGLSVSLRGITLFEVEMQAGKGAKLDPHTALYKLAASLIRDDHSLAVEGIAHADTPLTEDERKGYSLIPTSVEYLRETAGILPSTLLTVPADKASLTHAQLRKSYANIRPGNRVTGGVVMGAAGTRLAFKVTERFPYENFLSALLAFFTSLNRFNLKMTLREVPVAEENQFVCDLILHAATHSPHSGMHGGPFPVAELQLAKMVDNLVGANGLPNLPDAEKYFPGAGNGPVVRVEPLFAENDGTARPFAGPVAKAFMEIRLAPGNREDEAREHLRAYLLKNVPRGFELNIRDASCASPWITGITHPVFPLVLKALEIGYSKKPCLYGCGGSIPFVPKLVDALGNVPPLCLGAYDPDGKMHEPGESMSMIDWMGCARSIVHLLIYSPRVFPPLRI